MAKSFIELDDRKNEELNQEDQGFDLCPDSKNSIGKKTQLNLYIDIKLKREFRSIAASCDMKHSQLFEAYQECWKKHH
jgi:hypothetical protein